MLPTTVVAAGFVMVLTSIPATDMTAEAVLDVYRLRWQIELAFKRLKSGLGIHKLPAKDSRLARTWPMAHLILALRSTRPSTTSSTLPPVAMTTRKAIAISMWRLHDLLKRAFLAAILTALSPKRKRGKSITTIMRLLCDPPRQRKNQANAARALPNPLS